MECSVQKEATSTDQGDQDAGDKEGADPTEVDGNPLDCLEKGITVILLGCEVKG